MRLHPFRALRPAPELASTIASVPYDVVDREEAAQLAAGNPRSFLHVVRAEIDLPPDTNPYDPAVYAKAKENFQRLIADGSMRQDEQEGLFVYRQIMDGRAQAGVVGCCHVDDYENDLIKKHEKTRKVKEDDRTNHMLAIGANPGPVFLTYRDAPDVDRLIESTMQTEPLYDFTAVDGVRHTVWRVPDVEAMVRAFRAVPVAYVADGHHRSASAWRAGKARREANPNHTGEEEYNWFLSVLFPAAQLKILPYNRVIKDLGGRDLDAMLDELGMVGQIADTSDPHPPRSGSFCFYFGGGKWYRLDLDEDSIDRSDPIRSLDVALIEDRVLRPILGIEDQRTDERIDFVGGIRGTNQLMRLVDSGQWACAISMFPTSIEQLMAVADAGEVMPPKSTWFEPKLRSGLLVHLMD